MAAPGRVALGLVLSCVVKRGACSAPSVSDAPSCYENSSKPYHLDWKAEGTSFFDSTNFVFSTANIDPPSASPPAAQYMPRDQAISLGVAEAHDSYAILRTGKATGAAMRASAKIQTARQWKYYLAVMRFTHVPFGCGTWPAWWFLGQGAAWPNAGEMDIFETANFIPAFTSVHTRDANRCQLDPSLLNKPGCTPMPDHNGDNYNCYTDYHAGKKGCAPSVTMGTSESIAKSPGVMAVEWTERYIKTWMIPEAQIPHDIDADAPQPDTWDRWVTSYYPFAASEESKPGSCPNPQDVFKMGYMIFQIQLCGSWAGTTGFSCPGWSGTCNAFMGSSQAESYLAERAYFNITWLKVFKQSSTDPTVVV